MRPARLAAVLTETPRDGCVTTCQQPPLGLSILALSDGSSPRPSHTGRAVVSQNTLSKAVRTATPVASVRCGGADRNLTPCRRCGPWHSHRAQTPSDAQVWLSASEKSQMAPQREPRTTARRTAMSRKRRLTKWYARRFLMAIAPLARNAAQLHDAAQARRRRDCLSARPSLRRSLISRAIRSCRTPRKTVAIGPDLAPVG
jgi:hypothetical protein